jgi:hypothetical protein
MFALRRKPPFKIDMPDPIRTRMAALRSSILSSALTLVRAWRKPAARQSQELSRRSTDYEIPLLFPMF